MKRVAKPVFFIVALLIAFFFYSSWFGIKGKNGDNTVTYLKGAEDIRLGTDIRGGVEATFSPATKSKPTNTQMDSAESIIKERLIGENITDYEVYTDYNHSRIIVRFPWKTDEKDYDPQKAIQELAATAQVTFREGFEYTTQTTGSSGNPVYKTPKGVTASNIILKGNDIVKATPEMTTNDSGKAVYVVSLKLSQAGAEKFSDATARLVGKTISIWMDDTAISWPVVEQHITGGKCQIDGGSTGFTAADASALANKINAGALPFKLSVTSSSTINPTLGMSSLDAMKLAGLIAYILVAVFMLLIFRLPGLIADISMLGQIALTFAAVSGYFPFINSFTLTLPGICGIILSIGMGVDANIITDTRIKEELWAGKTLDYAISQGDKNSFSAIFDGNITTVIVALLLMLVFGPKNILSYWFGASLTGSIYSFGYTLLIGIIGNFLFGVGTTRLMLKSISRFGFARNKWLYGGTVPGKAFKIRFYENRRIYFAISLGVIAVGLIANGIFGTKLDINFKGGAVIKYSYSGEVQPNKIEQAVEKAVDRDVAVTINKNVRSASGTGKANNITLSFAGRDSISPETQKAVNTALNQVYPDAKFTSIEASSINPSMGRTFFEKCIVAILIAFVLLDLYVALRFRRIGGAAAGIFAIVALLHDVAMVYFTFIIFRIPLDNNFIAVVLTILGYSLNDTIVVYDRIRENRRLYGPKTGYDVLANTSINQTFTRSLYTAGTTVLAVATVLVVGMFYNLSSITTFALPMMIGVISGCYSSVCIASPLFVMWENHKTKKLALQASRQQQVHAQLAPESETASPESAAVPKTTAAAAKKKSGKKNTHKAKKKKH
ncbi:MAG: protein translocase subunit SecD [Oscillospiraceae bacterium]|jgi:protein-export membrane protein SecD/preprotein translocase SecF subunit|nr:protein translocase subunit SecD [Oscillospiraceae bacterium]